MKNFSTFFYKTDKKFVFNKVKPNLKNTTIIKLKTKEFQDWNNIASLIANNFRMKNSSQVYTSGQNFLGYLEFESGINQEVDSEKVDQLIRSYAGSDDFILNNVQAHARLVSSTSLEDREKVLVDFNKRENSGKKCSIFNSDRNLAGIITCKLKTFLDQTKYHTHINDEYGYILDNLEKHNKCIDIIEIQGTNSSVKESSNTESLRVNKLIRSIKQQKTLQNKLISVKTQNVKNTN